MDEGKSIIEKIINHEVYTEFLIKHRKIDLQYLNHDDYGTLLDQLAYFWRYTIWFNVVEPEVAKEIILTILDDLEKMDNEENNLCVLIGETFLENLSQDKKTAMLLYPNLTERYKNLYDKYKYHL